MSLFDPLHLSTMSTHWIIMQLINYQCCAKSQLRIFQAAMWWVRDYVITVVLHATWIRGLRVCGLRRECEMVGRVEQMIRTAEYWKCVTFGLWLSWKLSSLQLQKDRNWDPCVVACVHAAWSPLVDYVSVSNCILLLLFCITDTHFVYVR